MRNKVKIIYRVDDGYVGKDRPCYLTFDREEWDELTENEREQLVVEQAMQRINISWEIA